MFGDEVILNHPVEDWPLCDALLSWHSDGFPLKKVRVAQAAHKCCSSKRRRRMMTCTAGSLQRC